MNVRLRKLALLALLVLLAGLSAAVAACGGRERDDASTDAQGGGGTVSGKIVADGSSTVAPFTTAAAEGFGREQPAVQVTVGVSGTGGGFERFCADETDVSDASRPIKDEEQAACEQNGIEFVEFHIANDALTVVANPENEWADCLTVEQLRKIWQPESNVDTWKDVDAAFPDEKLVLFGPGTDSGTFDFFTEAIVGEEGASRSDYSASEDDNVIVEGVAGAKGALGYFGLSYYEQNEDELKAVAIDGGAGCVEPSSETAQSGEYVPLSRPLFIYVKEESLQRPEVKAFVEYVLDNEREIAADALFVPLTEGQLAKARAAFERSVKEAGV